MEKKNLSLLMDLYELTMAECYFHYKQPALATFDLFVRSLPRNRAYLIASGLADALEYLEGLRFGAQDLKYLKGLKIFSADFLEYLVDFRFSGSVWAMPEGTVFFANEPILRVTAPIIQAQIVESFLLNTVNLQTMIASKASRVVCAAGQKAVYDFSLRRTHGSDAAIKVARASYLAGFQGTSNVLAGRLYDIPVVGTMAHSFVMSFAHEIDSFLAYSDVFTSRSILLVDTYDTKKGIESAISAGLYLKEKGHRLLGVRLDSADIVSLSNFARKALDRAGLGYVKVFASGNLDEFKIRDIMLRKSSIDSFGVGTHMGTSQDAPFLDVIYKISEITDAGGRFLPTMKLSEGKVTFPGRKQVFRVRDHRGRFLRDILGLENEKINGQPLLKKVMDKGKVIYTFAGLGRIRQAVKEDLNSMPNELKDVSGTYRYPVMVSAGLKKLMRELRNQLRKRQ